MTSEIDRKIEKLWELISLHFIDYKERIAMMKEFIISRNTDAVGRLAGEIVVISQSDVCYLTAIDILNDLKKADAKP